MLVPRDEEGGRRGRCWSNRELDGFACVRSLRQQRTNLRPEQDGVGNCGVQASVFPVWTHINVQGRGRGWQAHRSEPAALDVGRLRPGSPADRPRPQG